MATFTAKTLARKSAALAKRADALHADLQRLRCDAFDAGLSLDESLTEYHGLKALAALTRAATHLQAMARGDATD